MKGKSDIQKPPKLGFGLGKSKTIGGKSEKFKKKYTDLQNTVDANERSNSKMSKESTLMRQRVAEAAIHQCFEHSITSECNWILKAIYGKLDNNKLKVINLESIGKDYNTIRNLKIKQQELKANNTNNSNSSKIGSNRLKIKEINDKLYGADVTNSKDGSGSIPGSLTLLAQKISNSFRGLSNKEVAELCYSKDPSAKPTEDHW